MTGAFTISIEKNGDTNLTFNIELRFMFKIINEYGDQLAYLGSYVASNPAVPMDLYDKYMERTRQTLGIKETEDILEEDD